MIKRYMAIDSGKTGAFATMIKDGNNEISSVRDLYPLHTDAGIIAFSEYVLETKPNYVLFETPLTHGLKGKQSVASQFEYHGVIRAVFNVISPNTLILPIQPSVWKRAMKLSTDKELSRNMAITRFPLLADQLKLKKHHNRAEALLMLQYVSECY